MEAFLNDCTPGYYNNEHGAVRRSHLGEPYGPGHQAFADLLEAWRDKGNLEGMVLSS